MNGAIYWKLFLADGTWFYAYGGRTDCYRLEYNGDGVPCGRTLVEAGI